MNKRAIIYARVSSDIQRDNNSIPSQVAACQKYIQEKGYMLVGNRLVDSAGYDVDSENLTGTPAFVDDYSSLELSRPALNQVFQFLDEYGFDVVVVHAIDRMARDPYIRQTFEIEFANRGVSVDYVLGQYEDTPEGAVKKDLDATFAKWENAKRVERCNRGKLHKATAKKLFVAGRPPYGYRIDPNAPGGLAVIEEQAQVVRSIFEMYAIDQYSIFQILNNLNSAGYSPSYSEKWVKSLHWKDIDQHGIHWVCFL